MSESLRAGFLISGFLVFIVFVLSDFDEGYKIAGQRGGKARRLT
jgi:hypothetical protein